ncbi:MAG: DUF192 domain-containing protein [Cyanobacteria bacterium P01_A01_bin.84]
MISQLSLFLLVLSIFLMGCSEPTPMKNPDTISRSKISITENLGQKLPITAKAILPKGIEIQLEVAKTRQQQAMGLMYRPELPDNQGMLFSFPSPQPVNFWMKNVPVSLDMVFMRDGVVRYIASSVPPCIKEPCPTYGPRRELIDRVIELRSGRATELGLKVGDRIKIRSLKNQ